MKNKSLTPRKTNEFYIYLAKSVSYIDFLNRYMDENSKLGLKQISQAEFTRKCNFSSRSLPRELLLKKRNLTHSILLKIEEGLNFPTSIKEYFRLLVSHDFPRLELFEESQVQEKIIKSREKNLKKYSASTIIDGEKRIVSNLKYPLQIYSTLTDIGTSIAEIQKLTSIPTIFIKNDLKEMTKLGIITHLIDKDLYCRKNNFFFLKDSLKDQFFLSIFKKSFRRILNTLSYNFSLNDKTTYANVLSFRIKKTQLPELKKQLHASMVDIMGQFDDDQGDDIISVSVFSCPERTFHSLEVLHISRRSL